MTRQTIRMTRRRTKAPPALAIMTMNSHEKFSVDGCVVVDSVGVDVSVELDDEEEHADVVHGIDAVDNEDSVLDVVLDDECEVLDVVLGVN